MRLNRESVADRKREQKVQCFARTVELVNRRFSASANMLCDFVSGLTDEQWQTLTDVANRTHDCGIEHGFPSEETRADVVHEFTKRALAEDKVAVMLAGELNGLAQRAGRPMRLVP